MKDKCPPLPRVGLSVDEAASIAPIGRTLLFRAIKDGRLRARKCGRRTVILVDDFNEFLRSLPVQRAA